VAPITIDAARPFCVETLARIKPRRPKGRGSPAPQGGCRESGQASTATRARRLYSSEEGDGARSGRNHQRGDDAKLLGRGGGGISTGRKWDSVAKAPAASLPRLQRGRV